jgi:hypothetical protein
LQQAGCHCSKKGNTTFDHITTPLSLYFLADSRLGRATALGSLPGNTKTTVQDKAHDRPTRYAAATLFGCATYKLGRRALHPCQTTGMLHVLMTQGTSTLGMRCTMTCRNPAYPVVKPRPAAAQRNLYPEQNVSCDQVPELQQRIFFTCCMCWQHMASAPAVLA